ncbi:type 2 isopentenyl-diphosphate Delta-isomerase [Niallia sp. XMNu-256]|uniref:type 2 isopentenyl-diphosphate Delta-isomerase n=1 Tax=Niallia sp. XMNu-256 TaxID=3082444 RepID=UPI0030D0726D
MSRSKRKWDHIQHALSTGQERSTGLDDVMFIHQSIPNMGVNDISLDTKIGGLSLSSPIFINAMTGGGGKRTTKINQELAIVSKELDLAIAVGSQMSAIRNPIEAETYRIVRKENRNGIIMGNLGSEASLDDAKRAIDMIEANLLQIHLNVIQELTMPEGDRDFADALLRIEKIVNGLDVPVIVKEVGFGMNRETVKELASIGVKMVDIGGYGGTNFAKIENKRRERFLSFFNQWGISTAASLIEAKNSGCEMEVVASGGLQTSLDVAKTLSLGANLSGISGHFLKVLIKEGIESLISEIALMHEELIMIMTALGVQNIAELQRSSLVISGNTHHWLNERNIDTKQYSLRKGARHHPENG